MQRFVYIAFLVDLLQCLIGTAVELKPEDVDIILRLDRHNHAIRFTSTGLISFAQSRL